jgi:hypothetical protein
MRVTGFWFAVGAIVLGLIVADLVTHPQGTQVLANGAWALERNTGNQLIGIAGT